MSCRWADCWCKRSERLIPSTGQRYTVEELPSEGAVRVMSTDVRVFRYVWLETRG
jgi:hypothetical protein